MRLRPPYAVRPERTKRVEAALQMPRMRHACRELVEPAHPAPGIAHPSVLSAPMVTKAQKIFYQSLPTRYFLSRISKETLKSPQSVARADALLRKTPPIDRGRPPAPLFGNLPTTGY